MMIDMRWLHFSDAVLKNSAESNDELLDTKGQGYSEASQR